QDFEPALPLPDLLPEVGGTVSAVRVHGVASPSVIAQIERQKHGVCSLQPRRHVNFVVAHGEMDQRPAGKGEKRLSGLALWLRMAIEAILVDRVADALREVRL